MVERHDVRRWIAGHQAAERRSFDVRRREGPMSPEQSFDAAMELCELAGPEESDLVRDREVEQARRLWTKLKRPWAARRG